MPLIWEYVPRPVPVSISATSQSLNNASQNAAVDFVSNVVFPGESWDTRTDEQAGLDTDLLDDFVAAVGGQGVIIRDGYLVRTWGSASAKSDVASAAKPVSALLLLIAIEEALVSGINETFDEYWTMQGDDVGVMTLAHGANMLTGYVRPEDPGEAYSYNDYAVNLFGYTLETIFGTDLNTAALDADRLGALDFEDGSLYSVRDGLGISTSPRDFARIGWFMLNKGNWNGTQIISEALYDSVPTVGAAIPRSNTGSADADDYLNVSSFGGDGNQASIGPNVYRWGRFVNNTIAQTATRLWPNSPTDAEVLQGHFGPETMLLLPSQGIVCAAYGSWGDLESDRSTMDSRIALLVSAVV